MSLIIDLPSQLERQLQEEAIRNGQEAGDYARSLLEAQLAAIQRERNQRAIHHMEEWLAEPPNEEDEQWPELEGALEANRAGQRKRFNG